MPLRLYWFPLSPPSRLVHFFCLAAGIEVELVLVDLFKGEQRLPSYLEINPDGKVPALDDDGFRMNEACCSIPAREGLSYCWRCYVREALPVSCVLVACC